MKKTNNYRKIAKIVGILFIIGTVSGSLSVFLSDSILGTPDYLVKITDNKTQVVLAALLELVMGVALLAIPYVIFPVLKKHNRQIAVAYIGARSMEGIGYVLSVITLLTLTSLSQEFVNTKATNVSNFETLGFVLLRGREWINFYGVYVVFNLGALLFYYLLYKSNLIPRFLSGWGLLAAIMWLVGIMLVTLDFIIESSTIYTLLFVPMFAQEMVMALWLIIKGFNPKVVKKL